MEPLDKLTTRELRQLLKKRGLSIAYKKKTQLVERLHNHLMQTSQGAQTSQSVDESENEGQERGTESGEEQSAEEQLQESGTEEKKAGKEKSQETLKVTDRFEMAEGNFLFKDVEDSLETYSGESSKNFSVWVKDFEEIATICKWNEIQKFLYARRLLRGAAKLAVEAEEGITSWEKLKTKLKSEFGSEVSSIVVHQMLSSRKKHQNETFLEYLFAMKHIANKGKVDEESLIAYVVQGIPDDHRNKAVLYEATTISQLKEKYKIYENIKDQIKLSRHVTKYETRPGNFSRNSSNRSNGKGSPKRCGNCGAFAHSSENCPDKQRGARCFKCNQFGHIAPNCPLKKRRESGSTSENGGRVNIISIPDMHTKISINGHECTGLVDTGSDVTLIRETVAKFLNLSKHPRGPSIFLAGFGKNLKRTSGSFLCNLEIQGEDFQTKLHVVPDPWISQDVLIGKDLIKDAKVIVENGRVTVERLRYPSHEEEPCFLEKINLVELVEDDTMFAVDEITCKETREKVKNMVESYSPQKLTKSSVQMKISVEDETPVYEKARRLAPKEKEFFTRQVQEWLNDGIITHSSSNFASPVVLAKKKDGSYRLCVDYRKLNGKIIKDRYPLPIIEEILENLHNARIFTVLDLQNGFFHVNISEKSRKYTAFITPDGQFEFLKVPFGLCNSPSVFQRFINTVFHPLIQEGVLFVYLDDIIIPSQTVAENLEKLELTLKVAEENGLSIKWKKCKFLRTSVEFLGHVIEDGSIKPSDGKILAVKNFPTPKNVKHVQSFLGLAGFFRKFIPNFSIIAKPLSDLLRKDTKFLFGPQQQDSFNHLKECLCSYPVLKLFNPVLETELHTDASRAGYGAVLLQRHSEDGLLHPVFYLSYKTSEAEKNYSSYELEVLAIIRSLKKLRSYLLGLRFEIVTDCKAFQLTMRKKKLSVDDPQKWYKHVPHLQRCLNSTTTRATGRTPFELMFGVKMRRAEDHRLLQILEEEIIKEFEHNRDEVRDEAKKQIKNIQEENRRYSLRKRKPARRYKVNDLVAIKRTQFMPGSKLFPKYLGPYKVTKVKSNDRYDVRKVGEHEGPNITSSAPDYMKPWAPLEEDCSSGNEWDSLQDGRVWERQQK